MQAGGPKDLISGVIGNSLCTGCGGCVSLCPYFKSHKGKTVMLFQCTRESGRCFAYCPRAELDLDSMSRFVHGRPYGNGAIGDYITIRSSIGRAPGLENFQTAGTVSSLVMFALDRGYIDAAVLTERRGVRGRPVIVTDSMEIPRYAATGYSASPAVSGFNEAMNAGYKKIGIVGTPCQVNAVTQLRGNPMGTENFSDPSGVVIGLFCTWALDTAGFENILKNRTDINSIRKYDIPPPPAGVMRVESAAGSVDIPLAEIRTAIPGSCSYCHDMTSEFADISVGVYEGKEKLNILVTRTNRGEDLVGEAISAGYLEAETLAPGETEGLMNASLDKKKRGLTKCMSEGLLNRKDGMSVLRLNGSALEDLGIR